MVSLEDELELLFEEVVELDDFFIDEELLDEEPDFFEEPELLPVDDLVDFLYVLDSPDDLVEPEELSVSLIDPELFLEVDRRESIVPVLDLSRSLLL